MAQDIFLVPIVHVGTAFIEKVCMREGKNRNGVGRLAF